jgi:hypothetical protein
MSKSEKNGTAVIDQPVQLNLIDFDALEEIQPIEPDPSEQTAQEAAPEVKLDTQEDVLATVQDFDHSEFANDPLKAEYLALGTDAKELADPADALPKWVGIGLKCVNILVKEKNIAPSAYDRSRVIKKCESAIRLCNVPESLVRPNELIAVYWLVKLDRSTTSEEEGKPRTFNSEDMAPDTWFGGNLSLAALRVLAKCVKKASKGNELDVFEFNDGFEPYIREWINRLREGYLSMRQVDSLIAWRKKVVAEEKKRAKYAGLTKAEIESIDASDKNEQREAKLTKLGSQALALQKMAAEECQKGKADLRDFLVNKQIISAPTVQEWAAKMTPGEAKALVQELVRLYKTQPDRINVFKALYNQTSAIVAQMKSAQEKRNQPAAKVA